MSNWICNFCEYVNENYNGACCSNCKNLNSDRVGSNNSAFLCGDNDVFTSYGSGVNKGWICKYCTFSNKFNVIRCEMCDSFSSVLNPLMSTRKVDYRIQIQSIDETIYPDDFQSDLLQAQKIRNEIISKMETGQKYIDLEFPPTSVSIGITSYNENGSISEIESISSMVQHTMSAPVKWLRPENLCGDEYSISQLPWLVTRNPSSDDIVQGKLGNCWMLTGLALIADRCDLLNRILITKEIDPYGIYQVRLCKDGIWTIVTIDDLFPANQFGQMIYSRANRKQLWVSLIEKATAKLYGSYECLTLGYCADGLATLTGFPCETLKLYRSMFLEQESFNFRENINRDEISSDKITLDTIWALLLSANEANFFLCVSCGCPDDNSILPTQLHQLGLRNLHAYAILDAKDIPSANVRLLRLKNPWARLTWKGKWSDSHESWSILPENIRNDLQPPGVSGEACGVFWISLDDVLTYFFALDICRYQPNFQEMRIQTHLPWPVYTDWNTKESYLQVETTQLAIPETNHFSKPHLPTLEIENNNTCAVLTVLEPSQLQIALWQSTLRFRKNKPVDIIIIICSDYKSPVGSFVASSNRQTSSYVSCDVFLDKGLYTIFYISLFYWQSALKLDYDYGSKMQFFKIANLDFNSSLFECTLSVHSSKPVLLNRGVLTPEMVPQVISQLAINKGHVQMFGEAKIYTLMKDFCGMIMLVVNPADNSNVKCTCDTSGSTNVRNTRGITIAKTEDIICPGFCQIITVLTQDDAYLNMSISHKYTTAVFPFQSLTEYPQLKELNNLQHWPPVLSILHQPFPLYKFQKNAFKKNEFL